MTIFTSLVLKKVGIQLFRKKIFLRKISSFLAIHPRSNCFMENYQTMRNKFYPKFVFLKIEAFFKKSEVPYTYSNT